MLVEVIINYANLIFGSVLLLALHILVEEFTCTVISKDVMVAAFIMVGDTPCVVFKISILFVVALNLISYSPNT